MQSFGWFALALVFAVPAYLTGSEPGYYAAGFFAIMGIMQPVFN